MDEGMKIALWRYQEIAPLLALDGTRGNLTRELTRIAKRIHEHPRRGTMRVADSTVGQWLYQYRRHGLDDLVGRPRRDAGHSRIIDDDLAVIIEDLVESWGLPSPPDWQDWLHKYSVVRSARNLLTFDPIGRQRLDAHPQSRPTIQARNFWSEKFREDRLQSFLKGFYMRPNVPYGFKRVPEAAMNSNRHGRRPHHVLGVGPAEEVEVVRLIFDLYVHGANSRTDICNLLNAERVAAPNGASTWSGRSAQRILADPTYIGANEFRGLVRHDVFPALVEKSLFHHAQAQLISERSVRILRPSMAIPDDNNPYTKDD